MKRILYEVNYEGRWYGGKAFVWAKDEDEAKALIQADERTYDFTNVTVEPAPTKGIVFNDNGDM